VRETVEPAGLTVEFNGDAEFPPIEQGPQELLGLMMALIVLIVVFRTFVAASIPILLALTALATAFVLLFILAGLTDINTITPLLVSMIGLGVGIDYSLFIVTRFRQLLHEGLSPGRRRLRGRVLRGPRRALRGPDGRDLGDRPGLLRPRLRHQARASARPSASSRPWRSPNSLLISVLSKLGHKVDRWKVPFLRPLDDSEEAREKTPIARWGRFVTANAKIVFPVVLILILVLAGTSALVRLGASDQGTQPKEQTARRAYDLLAEGFGPGFNGPIPIVVDVNGDQQVPQKIHDRRAGASRAWRPSASRSSTTRRRCDRVRHADVRAAGRGDG
jgi:RND superfamily putative drug exporter